MHRLYHAELPVAEEVPLGSEEEMSIEVLEGFAESAVIRGVFEVDGVLIGELTSFGRGMRIGVISSQASISEVK